MNLQTTKPHAKALRSFDGSHYWRVTHPLTNMSITSPYAHDAAGWLLMDHVLPRHVELMREGK